MGIRTLILGHGLGNASHAKEGELPETALVPMDKLQNIASARTLGSKTNSVEDLVTRVREKLEAKYDSVSAAWLAIESSRRGAERTLSSLQRELVQAGVSQDDAGHLLQAILENQCGQAAVAIPGDR